MKIKNKTKQNQNSQSKKKKKKKSEREKKDVGSISFVLELKFMKNEEKKNNKINKMDTNMKLLKTKIKRNKIN